MNPLTPSCLTSFMNAPLWDGYFTISALCKVKRLISSSMATSGPTTTCSASQMTTAVSWSTGSLHLQVKPLWLTIEGLPQGVTIEGHLTPPKRFQKFNFWDFYRGLGILLLFQILVGLSFSPAPPPGNFFFYPLWKIYCDYSSEWRHITINPLPLWHTKTAFFIFCR